MADAMTAVSRLIDGDVMMGLEPPARDAAGMFKMSA